MMLSRYNEYNPESASGLFRFNGRFTGFDQADYVLGDMSSFQQGNGELEFRRLHYLGFYGGDTFRVTPRLTLNFGLRWEPFMGLTDLLNREDQFIESMYRARGQLAAFRECASRSLLPRRQIAQRLCNPEGRHRRRRSEHQPSLRFRLGRVWGRKDQRPGRLWAFLRFARNLDPATT